MLHLTHSPPLCVPFGSRKLLTSSVLLGLLLLGACASQPPQRAEREPDAADAPVVLEPRSEVEILLARADEETEPDAKARFIVQAATLLQEQGEREQALMLLEGMALGELPAVRRAAVLLLEAELLQEGEAPEESLALLRPENFPLAEVDAAAQARYHNQRALALGALDRTLDAINERLQLDRLLPPEEQTANHDALWLELKKLPDTQLRSLSSTSIDFDARGWYELGLAMRGTDLDQQAASLRRWQSTWERHSAAATLPTELKLSLEAKAPARIALLLPLGAGAGQVIRDAFLGAYYSQEESGGTVPALRIYDAAASTDILALHAQARQDGAELIIGPLLKQHVAELMTVPDLGVPTLALNNVEGTVPASPLLYQFALSPEDEARQLARRAWRDGHRFAAVLSPRDTPDNDFYTRKRAAFVAEWEKLGGTVVTNGNYTEDYTNALTRLLALDASAERRRRVQEIIGRQAEFTQRRRQDVDFIYLVSQPEPARLIVPSLAYLFAGDIPVYASQDVFAGTGRVVDDLDLNGVLFPESPWLLSGSDGGSGIEQLKELFPANSAQNLRLQAFGIDAFRLASRLQLLSASSDFSIPGTSGILHMDSQRNIQRELSWATITQGQVRPAPR